MTSGPADVIGPLHMRERDLVDATGRVVLIHGTNVVNKSGPFLAPLENGWLRPQDFAEFQADGLNGVRLGVWAAKLMPAPGVIDTDYLAEAAALSPIAPKEIEAIVGWGSDEGATGDCSQIPFCEAP